MFKPDKVLLADTAFRRNSQQGQQGARVSHNAAKPAERLLADPAGQAQLPEQEVAEPAQQQLHPGRIHQPLIRGRPSPTQLKRMEADEIYEI